MVSFNFNSDLLVAAPTTNPKDNRRVSSRIVVTRAMNSLGFTTIVDGNVAPLDKDAIWNYTDGNVLRRWNAVSGNWVTLTANEFAKYVFRRTVLGANVDTVLESGDLLLFWDLSVGEVKSITKENLMATLGALRTVNTTEGIQGGGNLGADRTLKLNFNGLSAAGAIDAAADLVALYDASGVVHVKMTVADFASLIRSSSFGMTLFYSGT